MTRGRDAPPLLLEAARRLEPLDPILARESYLEAFAAALSADPLVRGGDAREVAAAVLAAGWEPSTRACDLLLDGLALLAHEGYIAAAPALKVALRAFRDERLSEEDELRWLWLAARIARALADDEAWDELTARPRTVEWHLSKVFGKLGIGSRRDLRSALSDIGAHVVSA